MTLPTLAPRRTANRLGRHPLVWIARELSLSALGGQVGTHTRAATATPTDSYAATRTVVHSQPAWSYVSGQLVTGLLLGTNANLAFALPILPQAMGGMIDFVENGGLGTASGGVWYLGNDGATGARVYVDSTGTQYRVTYTDGTTTRTSTMTGTAPTTGQRVRLRWELTASGTIQIWQSINGAAETTPGASAATTLPAAWAGTTMRLNSVGTANQGANIYLGCAVMLGTVTAAQLQAVMA